MSRVLIFSVSLVIAATFPTLASGQQKAPEPPSDLIVHEWGTFLAMQGSDGVTIDGMYHEEHALPSFVHSRSRDQLRLPSAKMKGETPVIYFYTDKPQRVGVSVGFPQGIWTQWYPQARFVTPGLATLGSTLEPRGGEISWGIELLPVKEGVEPPALPAASEDALWNFAREVDAAYVRAMDRAVKPPKEEYERFVFYRGLGSARLPIEMSLADGGSLHSQNTRGLQLLHLFVVRVEQGRGAYRYFPALGADESLFHVIPDMKDSLPLTDFTAKIADDLARRLTAGGLSSESARVPGKKANQAAGVNGAGLYPKEARAIVNTWSTSYFQTDGIRVLFVLPQRWTDQFIPMQISPKPKELVRVMVGRLEVLTPERERLAENAVRDLASADETIREGAFNFLREQGRYVEPIIRRVLVTTKDPSVQTLCKRLLLTDFVTELRSALNSASDGSRISEEPLHVRARLASLLRSVGLNEEAKQEAERVLAELQEQKEPSLANHEARHYLRARARAFEGLGDDAAAAESYAQFIRFASQVRPGNSCTACHNGNDAPRDMTWYLDWWAGRKFAQACDRAGMLDDTLAAHKNAAANSPEDVATQMMLAYLYEASGDHPKAQSMWAKIGVSAESRRRLSAAR